MITTENRVIPFNLESLNEDKLEEVSKLLATYAYARRIWGASNDDGTSFLVVGNDGNFYLEIDGNLCFNDGGELVSANEVQAGW